MKAAALAITFALLIGLPVGFVITMALTPLLWHLEPVLHMELAGHSGPQDWIFYVVWALFIPSLFFFFRWIIRRTASSSESAANPDSLER